MLTMLDALTAVAKRSGTCNDIRSEVAAILRSDVLHRCISDARVFRAFSASLQASLQAFQHLVALDQNYFALGMVRVTFRLLLIHPGFALEVSDGLLPCRYGLCAKRTRTFLLHALLHGHHTRSYPSIDYRLASVSTSSKQQGLPLGALSIRMSIRLDGYERADGCCEQAVY
jgi:hypothetical protein